MVKGKGPAPTQGKGRVVKIIPKTADLLKKDGAGKGKGKEREVVGDLTRLIAETKSLPSAVQVDKFAKIRALEILAFQNAIKSAALQGSTRVFQSLPRHLRRRAASHNPRRVPKRLRSRAAAEIDPGSTIAKVQRKKAKLRARGNLRGQSRTEQLLKRQRDRTWLPTHIYHAKRFHMVNLWSHRLALTPTLKSFRPAYRASRRKAIVHDTTYFGTIELEGSRNELVKVLSLVTGEAFAGERYESGARMAEITMFAPGTFPLGLIGPASLLWHADKRKIWIRVHPAVFTTAFDALKSAAGTLPSSSTAGLHIRDLSLDFGSFEIVGPRGGQLIRRIFRLCKDEANAKKRAFDSLGDPKAVASGSVFAFKVYDPRLHFPPLPLKKEEEAQPSSDGITRSQLLQSSSELAASPLWNSETRESTLNPSFKKSDLDHRRHELGLPGNRLRALAQDDRIPILVAATGPAFTLIFPRGWAQPILNSIVYTATLLGGLEERRAQHREAGVPCFPEHYGSVCKAGTEWVDSVALEDERRWSRRPPGKRIDHPEFKPDWSKIFASTEGKEAEGQGAWLLPKAFGQYGDLAEKAVNAFRKQRGLPLLPAGFTDNAVVHVQLQVEGRGSPGRMARIYSLDQSQRAEWIQAVDDKPDLVHDEQSQAQKLGELPAVDDDLVGYTTTGNFSLARGHGYALGVMSLSSFCRHVAIANSQGDGRGALVKVRNHGSRLCRLARIQLV